jgi:hypothetical protein
MKSESELKAILKNEGIIYVNTYSQDCDGVEAYGSSEFKSIEEYNENFESFCESIEGAYSWDIVSKEDTYPLEECGTFGHGWDIN